MLDLSPRSTVSGGVVDVYGEDRATEDQLVTPWTFSVARYSILTSSSNSITFDICVHELITICESVILHCSGYSLMRDPQYNKGLAFTEKERDAHYLRGLLPPTVSTQQLQEKKLMHNIRQHDVPLQKYVAMMDLQVTNHSNSSITLNLQFCLLIYKPPTQTPNITQITLTETHGLIYKPST